MVAQNSPALSGRRVVLFGGQGSLSLFSSPAASCAENDARSSVSGAELVSRCHAVFLAECRSLDTHTKVVVGLDPTQFTDLGDFLKPPPQFHHNGVVQATTICLYQLLHYLAEMEQSSLGLNYPTDQVLETTGFCSGLIAAAVVASSNSASEFLKFGIEAFRLAFWIGYRTVIESKKQGQPQNLEAPWSLVVIGLTQEEVEEHRRKFSTQVINPLQKGLPHVLNNEIY
jgi:Starter unit:ACP transacylase in aflatoxin biosynthesis